MNDNTLKQLAIDHQALIPSDNHFQRMARVLQALWREEQGIEIGIHRSKSHDGATEKEIPLGSRIAEAHDETELRNFLTDTIRDVVQEEIASVAQAKAEGAGLGKLYSTPRLYNDLLSSQPLCFNLFGELMTDTALATEVFKTLFPRHVDEVTRIQFEYSPGRGDERYTADSSAFDVFVEYHATDGSSGFVGIEVKYHENLSGEAASHKDRYEELAALMGCFRPESIPLLKKQPLQQIWRDHLLAGSLVENQHYKHGTFAFLYPAGNAHCRDGITRYMNCLTNTDTIRVWTLEEVHAIIAMHSTAKWVGMFRHRYLAFEKLNQDRGTTQVV